MTILQIQRLCFYDTGQGIYKFGVFSVDCHDWRKHGNIFDPIAGGLLTFHNDLHCYIAKSTQLTDWNIHSHRFRIDGQSFQRFVLVIHHLDLKRLVYAFTYAIQIDNGARPRDSPSEP